MIVVKRGFELVTQEMPNVLPLEPIDLHDSDNQNRFVSIFRHKQPNQIHYSLYFGQLKY